MPLLLDRFESVQGSVSLHRMVFVPNHRLLWEIGYLWWVGNGLEGLVAFALMPFQNRAPPCLRPFYPASPGSRVGFVSTAGR